MDKNERKNERKNLRSFLRSFYDILYKKVGDTMRETKSLEFKESITNTFLKTVSAYANYGTGKIQFGIKDDGAIIGIENPREACLAIENKINDTINPIPKFRLEIDDSTNVITLTVEKGKDTPYFYNGKSYRRSDSASIPVDTIELKRLVMEGENLSYDSLVSKRQDLQFNVLEEACKSIMGISALTRDLLITLELYRMNEGYTIAGELLADENSFHGVDMARFGESINVFLERNTIEHTSLLNYYNEALTMYRRYYQYSEIEGSFRKRYERIPETAFREAIANALVHRAWDIPAHTKISMFDDHIEIVSPGGLPKGLGKDQYLEGQISILRNPIIGNVFFRLEIIERYGTGIQRIQEAYKNSVKKPQFDISDNSIKIILPVIEKNIDKLTIDEKKIYNILQFKALSSGKLVENTGFGKTKVLQIVNKLVKSGFLRKQGSGRSTTYTVE